MDDIMRWMDAIMRCVMDDNIEYIMRSPYITPSILRAALPIGLPLIARQASHLAVDEGWRGRRLAVARRSNILARIQLNDDRCLFRDMGPFFWQRCEHLQIELLTAQSIRFRTAFPRILAARHRLPMSSSQSHAQKETRQRNAPGVTFTRYIVKAVDRICGLPRLHDFTLNIPLLFISLHFYPFFYRYDIHMVIIMWS